jgi:uncharacterized protein (TIGR02452 family)
MFPVLLHLHPTHRILLETPFISLLHIYNHCPVIQLQLPIMGREQKSQGLAPPAIRKDQRARLARQIINKTIPAILASNAKARKGSETSELIVDPGHVREDEGKDDRKEKGGDETQYVKRKGQGKRKLKGGEGEVIEELGYGKASKSDDKGRKGDDLEEGMATLSLQPPAPARIRIITTDTLTAAHILAFPSKYPSLASGGVTTSASRKQNPCVLNMASPLRPGGGVLTGATSQEEFLCARTTLLPSLIESYYRLPEFGGVFTKDVLVFRGSGGLDDAGQELEVKDRWWVDVISAGMLRFPELEGAEGDKRLGKKDRENVEKKMRAVLRIAKGKGARRIVLGAWGCGAYGNPVKDIANAWRKVLDGDIDLGKKKGKGGVELEQWGFEDVVFAITNEKMGLDFATHFGGDIKFETGPGGAADDEEGEEDEVAEELRVKIKEMDGQIEQVWNPELKKRLGTVVKGLRKQLREHEGDHQHYGEEDIDEEEEEAEEESKVDDPGF